MPAQTNVVSSEWVKWVAGALLTLNSVCVGYVVKMEARVATLETSFLDSQHAYAQHLADGKEVKADVYARLAATDAKQADILQSISVVREDVAAIRGALGIKRHLVE